MKRLIISILSLLSLAIGARAQENPIATLSHDPG